MKKPRMIWTGTLLCLLLLTACQSAPDKPTNSDTGNTPDSSVLQFSNPVENNTDAGGDVTSISDANMELVRSVNGTAIEETITMADGKQIILNAQVDTENVESVKQYQYEVLPVTDELRKMLFTTFFGERASEAIYDQRNDVWELHNSESIGDYYLYEHTMAMAGESVPGEEIFTLQYRDVNLYPFEDNLLPSLTECGVSIPLEDVISLCGTITDAIAPQNSYVADTVLPYGNQGRRPYYKIFFRRTADGMPITGYLLSVCYAFVMSLIIFWLNLRISKVLSYLAAVLVHVAGYILTIGFLTGSYRKFSLLANSLLMYHNISGSETESAYLTLPQSFLIYAAVAVVLFLLILRAIHTYDYRITVGTKQ